MAAPRDAMATSAVLATAAACLAISQSICFLTQAPRGSILGERDKGDLSTRHGLAFGAGEASALVVQSRQGSWSGASGATIAVAAALALASSARRLSQRAKAEPKPSPAARITMVGGSGSLALQGTPVVSSVVSRKSLKSCFNLYFKRATPYKDRARKNIRNRAYNIFLQNKYKKAIKEVLLYCIDLEFGDLKPGSMAEVMTAVKPKLDKACKEVDFVCVQGVLHRNTAARRKDRMCRAILRGCIAKGLIQKPEDPFIPAYTVLSYEMPKCTLCREPRPWQLPGWKSPWMLKREYEKWQKQKEEAKVAA